MGGELSVVRDGARHTTIPSVATIMELATAMAVGAVWRYG